MPDVLCIALAAFTDRGRGQLDNLVRLLNETGIHNEYIIYNKSMGSAYDWVGQNFNKVDSFIFIGAAGIAVRMISTHIVSKDTDPAVIVIDEYAKFVIPILSGHIGGANRLALSIAKLLGAQAVITTATDINGKISIDEWADVLGCRIEDISQIKHISSSILRDEKVGFYTDFELNGALLSEFTPDMNTRCGVCISLNGEKKVFDITLNIVPVIVTLGIGCRRNTAFEDLKDFIFSILKEHHISIKAVKYIASIDIKKDEECINMLSHELGVAFLTYSADELNRLEGDFTSSGFVKGVTGVDNVCERSAFVTGKNILIKKISKNGMTLAVSAADWVPEFKG